MTLYYNHNKEHPKPAPRLCCGARISVPGLGMGSDVREASRVGVLWDALWTVLLVRIRLILRQGEVQHNLNPNFNADLVNSRFFSWMSHVLLGSGWTQACNIVRSSPPW